MSLANTFQKMCVIRTIHYVKGVRIRSFFDTYSVPMLENTDTDTDTNSEYRHFSRSACLVSLMPLVFFS